MVTFLSGGTGTPKLLYGFEKAETEITTDDISVVVNTGDDIEISGNLVCPDIDTVLYTLCGRIDHKKWWGTEGDTFKTHNRLTQKGRCVERVSSPRRLGEGRAFSGNGEFMRIGDRDRATHILRTSLLDSGSTLTEATEELAERMGVDVDILPMSDEPVATWIETPDGWEHFQVWWVAHGGEPDVKGVEFSHRDGTAPTDRVFDAVGSPVIIGPSNPVTSLGPMLALDGFRESLRETYVVAVSPFIGGKVVTGPAAKLMSGEGFEPSSEGLYEAYADFLDVLIVDGESPDVGENCRIIEQDTRIESQKDSAKLLERVLDIATSK